MVRTNTNTEKTTEKARKAHREIRERRLRREREQQQRQREEREITEEWIDENQRRLDSRVFEDIEHIKDQITSIRRDMQQKYEENIRSGLDSYRKPESMKVGKGDAPVKKITEMTEDELQSYREREIAHRRDRDDPLRYFDKGILQVMVNSSGKALFPEEDRTFHSKNLASMIDELWKQMNDGSPDPVIEGEDPLLTACREIDAYLQLNLTADSMNNASLGRKSQAYEGLLAMRIYRRLTALQDQMNSEIDDLNKGRIRGLKTATDERMYAVANLLSYFEQQLFGTLGSIPEQPIDDTAVHIVCTGARMRNLRKEADLSGRHTDRDYALEEDHRAYPLFPHSPSPQDVVQGNVGNCYLVSAMSTLAAKHPDRIREMFRDNHDGTVTVRLYQGNPGNYQPVYVTVDKIMTVGQATGSEWVQTLERAVVASGLIVSANYQQEHPRYTDRGSYHIQLPVSPVPVPPDINEIYDRVIREQLDPELAAPPEDYPWLYNEDGIFQRWEPNFESISGGYIEFSMKMFLGNEADVEEIAIYDIPGLRDKAYTFPTKEANIQRIPVDSDYAPGEQRLFEKIEEACRKNWVVGAGTYTLPGKDDHVKVAGINQRHAYSVLGTKKVMIDGYERLFIKVRNPHGGPGRTYVKYKSAENDRSILMGVENSRLPDSQNPDNNGVGYVELKDFVKEFKTVTFASVKESCAEKANRIAAAEQQTTIAWRQAFLDIMNTMDTASHEQTIPWNSKEYNKLRSCLSDLIFEPFATYSSLEERMGDLREKIEAYVDHAARHHNTDRSREIKLEGCSMLMEVLSGARNLTKTPQTVMKERIADRLLQEIRSLDTTGLPEDDSRAVMKRFAAQHPDAAKARILESAEFRKWEHLHSNYTKLFEAALDPDLHLSSIGLSELTEHLKKREMAVVHSLPKEKKPDENAPADNKNGQPGKNQPEDPNSPPMIPQGAAEISFL